jgi:hypothetical protein
MHCSLLIATIVQSDPDRHRLYVLMYSMTSTPCPHASPTHPACFASLKFAYSIPAAEPCSSARPPRLLLHRRLCSRSNLIRGHNPICLPRTESATSTQSAVPRNRPRRFQPQIRHLHPLHFARSSIHPAASCGSCTLMRESKRARTQVRIVPICRRQLDDPPPTIGQLDVDVPVLRIRVDHVDLPPASDEASASRRRIFGLVHEWRLAPGLGGG